MSNVKKLGIMMIIFGIIFGSVGCSRKEITGEPPEIENKQPSQPSQDVTVPQDGGEIKISMRNPKDLNPIINLDRTVDQTLKLVFDTLVSFDANDQVIPHIAESWSMNTEGTVLDIKLKDHIQWHDGITLTANDVVFTLDAIKEATQSPYKVCIQNIVSYKATSDDTVRIVYKEPFSGYAYRLYFPILPAHISDINTNPIGTGPYVIQSFTSTKQMELTRNSNYFKGKPHIDKIKVVMTPDPESDLYAFDQKLIDVVSTDVVDWEKYAKNKKSRIHEYTTMYYDYIGFNFNRPIFQNSKTRQALLYGIDRPYLLEKFYLNHGVITDVPVSPFSWLYEAQSKQYEMDVEKAKELLGGNLPSFSLLVNSENTQRRNVALAIRKMYKNIGIDMDIVEVDEETYMDRVQNKNYDIVLGGWDLSIIPDLSFAFHSSAAVGGANYGGYTNSEMDQLLKNAFISMNNEELKDAYSKLQMYVAEQLPYASLYFRSAALITSEKIKGEIQPHHMNIYHNIYEWYVNEAYEIK